MKKGEIYEGIIEKVDFPNKGYVILEDQKILIKWYFRTEGPVYDSEETKE